MSKWILKRKKADIKTMALALGISEIFAQILVNRGINTKRAYREFISPSFDNFFDINIMKDIIKAYGIVNEAIAEKKKILVYGDYDVDGVMSTAILVKGISALSGNVSYYIPHRQEEGYGLNLEALETIKEVGVELLILCDNGIAALPEIDKANEYNIKTVVIDHHEPAFVIENDEKKDILPKASAIVDPKQSDCEYPFKQMCAAGLCFRFICGLYEYNNIKLENKNELLILAAMATFCDIVDLTGDNRVITYEGLKVLNSGEIPNLGLKTLIKEKNYSGKYISEFTIGFILGPCINASGRLESAAYSEELILTNDEQKAVKYAELLAGLNDERKSLTQEAFDRAFENPDLENPDKIIVLYDESIHESIAGIVAGRIKERLNRPVIVITGGDNGAKGSGRSIEGYNMFEGLSQCKDLFTKFGGHAMAAGFSLPKENVDILRKRLNENADLTEENFLRLINVDMVMDLDNVTFALYDSLNLMGPFGKENKEPLFSTLKAKVSALRVIDEKNTIIFTFETSGGRRVKGVCFGKNEQFDILLKENFDGYIYEKLSAGILRNIDFRLDIVYYITINEYNGDVSMQLNIRDFRM